MSLFGWMKFARAGYESAEYRVVESDGPFQIRDYPDLVLVTTKADFDRQGRDGSFMKLFGYISGANQSGSKIAMTTPVFMGKPEESSSVQMGFVLPKQIALAGAPQPTGNQVEITTRQAGRFAVVRFAGMLNSQSVGEYEAKLRDWIASKGLVTADSLHGNAAQNAGIETAGYDPPFTPGPLRRNEVLIRLSDRPSNDLAP